MTQHVHARHINLTNYPSPELTAAIEDASIRAGLPVRVRVLFRFCGHPGKPGPFHVRITVHTPTRERTTQVDAALWNAADRLTAADQAHNAAA